MSFDVKESRMGERMSFSGSGSNDAAISVVWHKEYDVEWTGASPANVSAADVLRAPGIPIVNRSIFATTTTIMPFVICRDKTAERNPDRISRWKVRTKWSTANKRSQGGGTGSSEESDNIPIAIPASIDDLPTEEHVSLGETDRVIYQTKQQRLPIIPVQCARTPAGNYWNEPVIERLPIFELKLTQYEDAILYDQMIERKFKVNDRAYRGKDPGRWIIEQVEAQEVEVLLTTGPTAAALVTYTILLSPDTEYGWNDTRGLFDTQFLQVANDRTTAKLFQNDEPGTSDVGYIQIDGTKRGDQTGLPDYISYRNQDDINFGDFLKA
jgi:hypothetical protein